MEPSTLLASELSLLQCPQLRAQKMLLSISLGEGEDCPFPALVLIVQDELWS